ncbi:TetR/AcrR family transcriptional regulator [Streptomyces sp. NPDC048172]|uniref:TetR/AcrR family transcriptional regulator n=1 Tax=Streptomyces sp. NPDC048172 TaxID=3365505 RepID=UPI003722CE3C
MAARKQSASEPETESCSESGQPAKISLWERLERPASAPRQTLTPRRIAEAGVAIADAEGPDAITMRKLATRLGVAPMAAYRYVSGKDEVLELMVDLVYAELTIPEGTSGWRESLRALAVRTRDLTLRHPWLTLLPPRAEFGLTPHRIAMTDQALTALDGLGLDMDARMTAVRTVEVYAHGAAGDEVALRRMMADRGWSGIDEVKRSLAPQMRWLMENDRNPAYLRYLREAAHKEDPQWRFELGLECVLDGIGARLGIEADGTPGGPR